jgi:hypothetical protein
MIWLLANWKLAAMAVLLALLGLQTVRVSGLHEDLAKLRQAHAEQDADRQRIAREAEAANNRTALARFNQAQEAINAARTREISLRADADGARSELDRLRIATARRAAARSDVPSESRTAADQPAATEGIVFLECASAFTELAREADGHASDVQTLRDGWPR